MHSKSIGGVQIPDSKIAQQATELVRDLETELLFQHSVRVYLWAALSGKRKNLAFDSELLYVAALFHDVGLTHQYQSSQRRFEVDGANAAREFLRGHGVAPADLEQVWLAIALHTTPGVPEYLHPNIALLQEGAGMDVVGRGYAQYAEEQRRAVTAAYPRGQDFEAGMIDAFYEGMKHRPQSTYGTFNDDVIAYKDKHFQRGDFCSLILRSPWTS